METIDSIIQGERECYITGATNNIHSHHVYGGANRKLSEKYGLKVWLGADWHNMSNYGVHFDKVFDNTLKQTAQKKAMEYYNWSIEDFIKIFGRNYID